MSKTKIEWATHTVNWQGGCTKVSPACANCYAILMSQRLARMSNSPARYHDGIVDENGWTGRLSYDAEALRRAFEGLARARKPRRVFCNSMTDTFHELAEPRALADLAHAIKTHDQSSARALQSGDRRITKISRTYTRAQLQPTPAANQEIVWILDDGDGEEVYRRVVAIEKRSFDWVLTIRRKNR